MESYVSAHSAENNMINDAKADGESGLRRVVGPSRIGQKNYVETYGENDDELNKYNNMDPCKNSNKMSQYLNPFNQLMVAVACGRQSGVSEGKLSGHT